MAGDSAAKTTLQPDSEGYTRLHITPLDADLLKVVVPAAVLPQARNISYHTLETLPEKRYGFVELPLADADKLRKKLNGATLRGAKVRIEQARPTSIHQPNGDAMAKDEVKDKKSKKDKKDNKPSKEKKDRIKKRKLESEEVEGVVIEDRKIKRGWTVTESDKIQEKRRDKDRKSKDADGKKEKKLKKREVKSKYTDAPECLFKQKLPEPPTKTKKTTDDDDDEDAPKRKKRKGANQVVVHEFEKTHKYPTFLKSSGATTESKPLTFEDGKGWVDEEGNVVDNQKITRPSFANVKVEARSKRVAKPAPVDDDDTSSSGSSSDSESDADAAAKPTASKQESKTTLVQQDDDTTSSSGSSEEDSSDDDSSDEKPAAQIPIMKGKAAAPATLKRSAPSADNSDDTSSSGSSSEDESDLDESPVKQKAKKLKVDTKAPASPLPAAKIDSARPKSSGSAASLTIQIPPVTPAATKVHPLEALYKRPAGEEAAPDAGFSFFGNNDDDIEEDADDGAAPSSQVPMTPFSKQDFEFRNIRSAAPTPDTAHPSRSYNLWPRGGEDDIAEEDEEDEDGEDQDAGEDTAMTDAANTGASADKSGSKSEFQNWFWEHRGDLNRSWKKRRKTASKEKRNRENRARAARAI
ncbi:hypothetical protein E8E14_001353 [Neopestalotiopsis sp. 37M]|nr:hypothetical protein E8E14_001353 [Neopestalotiopsis sp. 37M]